MWSSILVLALVTAADPMRLLAVFLVITRPRPVQNLFAYLVGCLTINAFVLLIPLTVLHFTQMFSTFVQSLTGPTTAGGSAVQPVPIGMGVLALLTAAVMAVRLRLRRRANLPTKEAGNASTMALEPSTPLGDSPIVATKRSAIRTLFSRVYGAWKNGALWVSFLMGLTYSPVQATIALAIIATSGAALGTQLSAAIAFIILMLGVVEIILISCIVAPAKTQQVLRPLHDWVQTHLQQFVAAIFAAIGLSLLVTGMGIV